MGTAKEGGHKSRALMMLSSSLVGIVGTVLVELESSSNNEATFLQMGLIFIQRKSNFGNNDPLYFGSVLLG